MKFGLSRFPKTPVLFFYTTVSATAQASECVLNSKLNTNLRSKFYGFIKQSSKLTDIIARCVMSEANETPGQRNNNPSLKATNKYSVLLLAFSERLIFANFLGLRSRMLASPQAIMSVAVGDLRVI